MSYSWDQAIAWLGLVVPLFALAWAAVQHVQNEKRKREHEEYRRFIEIMRELGTSESTPGSLAALFELRKFTEYSDVIVRMCEDTEVHGTDAKLLIREMELTAEHLKKAD